MLDPLTLLFVLAATFLFSTCILSIAWFVNKDVPGVGDWALGFLLAGVAWFFFVSRAFAPLLVSVVAGNALFFTALYFNLRGAQKMMSRPVMTAWVFAVAGIAVLGAQTYWTVVDDQFSVRIAIGSTYFLMFYALAIHAFWPRKTGETFVFAKFLIGVLALNMVKHALLLGESIVQGGELGMLDPSLNLQIMYASGIATVMLLSLGYIAVITEYLHRDLRERAERDSLTGAYNRHAFYALAEHVMKRHKRDRDHTALIMMDLDHFKRVNDTFGHAAGDEVLKRAAQIAQDNLRDKDIMVRLGGEEFAMLLPSTGLVEAEAVAERIRKAVEAEPCVCDACNSGPITITASFGLTAHPMDGTAQCEHIDDLIRHADTALYAAKRNGRNQTHVANMVAAE